MFPSKKSHGLKIFFFLDNNSSEVLEDFGFFREIYNLQTKLLKFCFFKNCFENSDFLDFFFSSTIDYNSEIKLSKF